LRWEPDRLQAAGACALFWIVQMLDTEPTDFNSYLLLGAYGALALGIVTIATRINTWLVLGYIGAVGIGLRLIQPVITNSDVWLSIREAISTLFAGGDPYAHYYTSTVPPGSPFPYLPGAMLYGILQNGWWNGLALNDKPAAIVVIVCFVILGRIYGPGLAALGASLYASSELVIWRSLDGSNDTALAGLIAVGVVSLAIARDGGTRPHLRRLFYIVSALMFGWAIGFKALAWPVYPFVVLAIPQHERRSWLTISLGSFGVLCLPFFIWNPSAFVHQIWLGFTYHTTVWGLDIWNAIEHIRPGTMAHLGGFPLGLAVFVFGLSAMLLWRQRPATLGEGILRGAALLAIMLAMPRWSTTSRPRPSGRARRRTPSAAARPTAGPTSSSP
jgi:hypothetical protein